MTTHINHIKDFEIYLNPLNRGKLRNDPCPCGSGKKIKKCHGIKARINHSELEVTLEMINNFNRRFNEAFKNNLHNELEKLSKGDLT